MRIHDAIATGFRDIPASDVYDMIDGIRTSGIPHADVISDTYRSFYENHAMHDDRGSDDVAFAGAVEALENRQKNLASALHVNVDSVVRAYADRVFGMTSVADGLDYRYYSR